MCPNTVSEGYLLGCLPHKAESLEDKTVLMYCGSITA